MIEHIVAIDSQNGIARENTIPWDIPEDIQFFRDFIQDKRLLVGRKTYEEIGRAIGSYMYILTSAESLRPPLDEKRGEIITNLPLFMKRNGDEPLVVIGGQDLYTDTLAFAGRLHVTRVADDWGCDRFYPEIPEHFNRTVQSEEKHHDGTFYRFETYERV